MNWSKMLSICAFFRISLTPIILQADRKPYDITLSAYTYLRLRHKIYFNKLMCHMKVDNKKNEELCPLEWMKLYEARPGCCRMLKVFSRTARPRQGWIIILLPAVLMTGWWCSQTVSHCSQPPSSPATRPRSPRCPPGGGPAAAWGRSPPRPPPPSRQTSSGGRRPTCRDRSQLDNI